MLQQLGRSSPQKPENVTKRHRHGVSKPRAVLVLVLLLKLLLKSRTQTKTRQDELLSRDPRDSLPGVVGYLGQRG